MWFIVLIVLAIAAFFIIKALKSRSDDQTSTVANTSGESSSTALQSDTTADVAAVPSEQPAESIGTSQDASSIVQTAAPAAAAADNSVDDSVDGSASTQSAARPAGSDTGAIVSLSTLESGDTLQDVREMIKVLNLRGGDAARLSITKEQFDGVWAGDENALTADELASVAARLRSMLA